MGPSTRLTLRVPRATALLSGAALLALALSPRVALADVYMNNPRGSNNKLNEAQTNAANQRRLFNSQNNAAGGYQVGDNCEPVCSDAQNRYNASAPGAGEGVMKFYVGSRLPVEWTVQHACGPDDMGPKSHCDVILQYMCEDPEAARKADPLGSIVIRDGSTTKTIPFNADPEQGAADANDPQYGRHEAYTYYKKCRERQRNRGLFTADQNVRDDRGATATRQHPNGNDQYGYECPEERDYYPYWHPTPWRDAAILTSDPARCAFYQEESENVKGRGECSVASANQEEACRAEGGVWRTAPPHGLPPPPCARAQWVRDNHHGNGLDGYSHNYNWSIPQLPEGVDRATCVLRVRYNISTSDYEAWGRGEEGAVDSRYNNDRSPVKDYPEKDFVKGGVGRTGPLRLALDTSQMGRTFEDRTHRFEIVARPKHVPGDAVIHNLNVRGRRGNIVQVYPSVEYDFVPNVLVVRQDDYVHVQWTGSDANNNGNDGEGRRMTDRSNLVEVASPSHNVPRQLSQYTFLVGADGAPDAALAERFAYLGQNSSAFGECDPEASDQQALSNCKVLNLAPAYFDGGLLHVKAAPGQHHLLSTRNNNFSNRSQKSTVIVLARLASHMLRGAASRPSAAVIAGAVVGAVLGVGVLSAASYLYLTGAVGAALVMAGLRPPTVKSGVVAGAGGAEALPTQEEEEAEEEAAAPHTPPRRSLTASLKHAAARRWGGMSPRARCLVVFGGVNLAVALEGFCLHTATHFPYYALAKAGGYMLDLNLTLILFPVMRNWMSFLRMTPLAEVLPLDDHILFHQVVGGLSGAAVALHVAMHYVVMRQRAERDDGDGAAPSVAAAALGTLPGFTGHLAALLMGAMFLTAWGPVKRATWRIWRWTLGGFNTFHFTHQLYIPVYGVLLLHAESFHKWAFWPLVLLLLDKLIGRMRAGRKVHLLQATLEKAEVLKLEMDIQRFRYKPGQYLYLNCPDLTAHEWHPFTISSAPEEALVSVHIRTRGDWTSRLKELVCPALPEGAAERASLAPAEKYLEEGRHPPPLALGARPAGAGAGGGTEGEAAPAPALAPLSIQIDSFSSRWDHINLRVDGPYGTGSEHVFDYDVAVLVGAGIGVTPFASIVKSARLRSQQAAPAMRKKLRPAHIYFYWVCRDMQEFNWFSPMLQDADNTGAAATLEGHVPHMQINTYMTGELDLDELQQKPAANKQWAGKKWAGRPNWRRIFKEIARDHPGICVGVFLCGPGASELAAQCKASSTPGGTTFDFHKENF